MNRKRKSIIWRDFMLRTCGVRKSRGAYRHMLVEADKDFRNHKKRFNRLKQMSNGGRRKWISKNR